MVILDEVALGKPQNFVEAEKFLRLLSGRSHRVITALGLAPTDHGRGADHVEETVVTFHALTDEDIRKYVATGEPMDKAGAYGIQGAASKFVSRVDGSWSNVVGLPVEALEELLKRNGWNINRKKSNP